MFCDVHVPCLEAGCFLLLMNKTDFILSFYCVTPFGFYENTDIAEQLTENLEESSPPIHPFQLSQIFNLLNIKENI